MTLRHYRSIGPVVGLMVASAIISTACSTPGPTTLSAVKAFPELRFERPVQLTHAPGEPHRLYVVEQAGRIWRFENRTNVAEKTLFLDITDRVSRRGNEEGLLALAFHPRYAENRQAFIHYSAHDRHGVIARFTAGGEPPVLEPGSEQVVLRQPQPYRNHNGGSVVFGPDGYLYVGFGDGGWAGDPDGNGQSLGTLLGKILRIDVDAGAPYRIPPDNPFLTGHAGARPEIWAYGLRNPWRFSFDRATGRLWVGDVGQNRWEEIDIVERGGNYGWDRFEGRHLYDDAAPLVGTAIPPVFDYEHPGSLWRARRSVTGGHVYRGQQLPALQGKYICGDYQSGEVWVLSPAAGGRYDAERVAETHTKISSFGEDAAGEVYLVTFDGHVYRLVEGAPPPPPALPERLSESGYFASMAAARLAPGAFGYQVNSPLWSDGSAKERHVVVPAGETVGFHPSETWSLPAGTVVTKTFSWPLADGSERRLETRIIRRDPDGWTAGSYVWNDAQDEARLAVDGAAVSFRDGGVARDWIVPSASDCRSCHFESDGFVLGLRTVQLDRGDQLQRLVAAGVLESIAAGPASWTPLADPADDGLAIDRRARAYLDANCAFCHRPAGAGNAAIDLRHTTPLIDSGLLGRAPDQGDLGLRGARLLSPGAPQHSVLLERIRTTGSGRMPPVASRVPDPAAVALLRAWIEQLDD